MSRRDAPGCADRDPAEGVAARHTAWTALSQISGRAAWASPVVDTVLSASGLDARDRAFAANLVFSTLRWQGTLDWILSHLVDRGLDRVQPDVVDVLRLGTYELRHGAAPAHAVVDTWVQVTRRVAGPRPTGFVNGVLRNVDRRAAKLPWPDRATDHGLGLASGYPAWVVGAARERFGDDRAAAVLDAGNRPADLALRAVAPREQVLATLAADGVTAKPGTLSPDAVVLTERRVPADLDVIADGLAVVQDQSSQMVGHIAAEGLAPGAVAVDLCAAPGGKATHLAQSGLAVTAVDRHAGRLRQVADLADRLGLDVTTVVADGRDSGLRPASADLVLVDAPCSGLGVVRRRPELRWRKDPADIPRLARLQQELLTAAADLVRPGGRVVYSVCTWTVAETDRVVRAVLDAGRLQGLEPPAVGTPTAHGSQLAPDRDEGDGMYIAVHAGT